MSTERRLLENTSSLPCRSHFYSIGLHIQDIAGKLVDIRAAIYYQRTVPFYHPVS
jgi:hypothetical protein